jgi:hypothetical protein
MNDEGPNAETAARQSLLRHSVFGFRHSFGDSDFVIVSAFGSLGFRHFIPRFFTTGN